MMKKPILEIKYLNAQVDEKPILKSFSLTVYPGEIHAIMGPNGAGKSTLARVLAGHPAYEITEGSISFKEQDLLQMEPEKRSHAGLFMSFQYPVEIPGVSNADFLRASYNAKQKANNLPEITQSDFEALLSSKMQLMDIKSEFKTRDLNSGFSGGEKKRNEILQMAMLEPDLAILDETDSGLDIDAMRIVAQGVSQQMVAKESMGLILITHYQRLLDYIKPHHVHVMLEGAIVRSGGPELALELEERGYDWIVKEAAK